MHFFKLMLPYTLLAAVMLLGMILLRKCVVLGDLQMRESEKVKNPWKVAIYAIIFLLCLLCVSHLLPVWVVMLVTIFGSVCDRPWNFLKKSITLFFLLLQDFLSLSEIWGEFLCFVIS